MGEQATLRDRSRPWVALALRVILGVPLVLHGAQRICGVPFADVLDTFVARQLRFLAPDPAAWLALVGGALLLVGLATRPVAAALGLVVVMSRMRPLWQFGVGDLLFLMLAWLVAAGAGRFALDKLFVRRRSVDAGAS